LPHHRCEKALSPQDGYQAHSPLRLIFGRVDQTEPTVLVYAPEHDLQTVKLHCDIPKLSGRFNRSRARTSTCAAAKSQMSHPSFIERIRTAAPQRQDTKVIRPVVVPTSIQLPVHARQLTLNSGSHTDECTFMYLPNL
jgi:hypothetical protein